MRNNFKSIGLFVLVTILCFSVVNADDVNRDYSSKIIRDNVINLLLDEAFVDYDVEHYGKIYNTINGRVVVPLRLFAETLGMQVEYKADFNMVSIRNINDEGELLHSITFVVGDKRAINTNPDSDDFGKIIRELEIPFFIDVEKGRSYIPVRAASELLGFDVDWVKTDEYVENYPNSSEKSDMAVAIYMDKEMPESSKDKEIKADVDKTRLIDDTLRLHPLGNEVFSLFSYDLIDAPMTAKPDTSFTEKEVYTILNNLSSYYVNPVDLVALDPPFDISAATDNRARRQFIISAIYDFVYWASDKFPKDETLVLKYTIFGDDASKVSLNDKLEKILENGSVTPSYKRDFRRNTVVSKAEFSQILSTVVTFKEENITYELPKKNIIPGGYISQLYPVYAPVGCEATSLLMGLKSKGYAEGVSLREFLDAMPKTSRNPEKGFVGSPYIPDPTKRTRTTIFPPILTLFASEYGNVVNISGYDADAVKKLVLRGNPVAAYMTMKYEKPFYRWYDIEGDRLKYLSNNHIVLVAGYDTRTRTYFIRDPYNVHNKREEYQYWISEDIFDPIYNERKHGVAVY